MFIDSSIADLLHNRVGASHADLGPKEWGRYLGFATKLPALLRENGLQQTLDFLRHQASDKAAAARLLEDWLGQFERHVSLAGVLNAGGQGLDQGAEGARPGHIQTALRLGAARRASANYFLASELALAEANRLKRSAEALDELPPGRPTDAPQAQYWGADVDDALTALPEGPPELYGPPPTEAVGVDQRQHPGLVWRFGGLPAKYSEDEGNQIQPWGSQQFKTTHRDDVLERTRECLAAGSDHERLYSAAYRRWERWTRQHCEARQVQVEGRLLIGIGAPTVFETQMLLHPVYGLPYIPGSTLKGALKAWLKAKIEALPASEKAAKAALGEMFDALFGLINETQDDFEAEDGDRSRGQAGLLRLHDAWCVPGGPSPVVAEVETPHHAAYYSGERDVASVFDSPTPIAQFAVQGKFLLAVGHHKGLSNEWAAKILQYLLQALKDPERGGLGGKAFSAGYGRLAEVASAQAARTPAPPIGGANSGKTRRRRPPNA